MKRIFLILLVLFYAIPLLAQTEFGINAGITANKVRRTESILDDYEKPTLFYSANALANLWLNKKLFLSSGINFERTGSRIVDLYFTDFMGNASGKGDLVEQLDYLGIPLSLHYSFGAKNKFSLGAGIFGSYLLGAHAQIRIDSGQLGSSFTGPIPSRSDVKDYYEDFNYGVLFNASYRIALQKNWMLLIGLEDRLGLQDVRTIFPDEKYKTHSLGLYAGLLFQLK